MASLPPALTNEVGPLKVWQWIAAGIAGIGLGILANRAMNRGAVSSGSSASVGGNPSPATGAGTIGSVAGAVGLANNAPPATPTGPAAIESNQAWRTAALRILIEQGFGPLQADQALANYLDGRAPTPEDAEAIDIALSQVGLPPSPPTIVPVEQSAAPTTTTPATTDAAVDIYAGDRLAQIVREAYRDILAREPDAEGLQFWRGRLASGDISIADFRRHFAAAAGKEFSGL